MDKIQKKIINVIAFSVSFLLIFTFYPYLCSNLYAQTSIDLTEYVAGVGFVEHYLSTGEHIYFTGDGGSGPASPVRMYKNDNYEQFFVGSSGIYRREDTSWAPLPDWSDAICLNGTKAVYTYDSSNPCIDYNDGDTVTNNGAQWSPNVVNEYDTWVTEVFQVTTIENPSGTSPTLKYCSLSNLSGYEYPAACNVAQKLRLTAFYEPGQYTFCTGITNEEDLIQIDVIQGPGSGDTFFFMKGWGLVGFEAPGFEAGLMGPGADASLCVGSGGVPGTGPGTNLGPGDPYGATPHPYPPPVSCSDTADDEFHSLRPYQASPCNENAENLALFCGNDFIIRDEIVIDKIYYDTPWSEGSGAFAPGTSDPSGWDFTWIFTLRDPVSGDEICIPGDDHNCLDYEDPGEAICETPNCTHTGDTETCEFVVDRIIPIAIDLDGAEFPIMGYTEPSEGTSDPYEVINLINDTETLNDPEKVSEYVSWYLNGVIGRNEYIDMSMEDDERINRIISFSGPLKRLLSLDSQNVERIEEINNATVTRHDQKVANETRLSDFIGNTPPLLSEYERDEIDDYLDDYNDWQENPLSKYFSFIPFSSTEDRKGQVFISEYQFQPIYLPNSYLICSAITDQTPADLFFSHMQEGVELADLLQSIHSPQGADLNAGPMDVRPIDISNCNIAETRINPGDNLFPGEITATAEYTADVTCEGFFLHGDGRLCGELPGATACESLEDVENGDLICDTYYNQVDCENDYFCGENCRDPHPCAEMWDRCAECDPIEGVPGGYSCYPTDSCCPGLTCADVWDFSVMPPIVDYKHCVDDPGYSVETSTWGSYDAGTCTTNVYVSFKTNTTTPLATEVWSKLVSGPFGAFRRIFPQIEDVEGRPIRRLWDLPTETSVLYTAAPPVEVVGGGLHQLYFPHIGGVHEYFLNCLQKTLRPQGYGQGCINAPVLPPPPPPGSGEPSDFDCSLISTSNCCICLSSSAPGQIGDVWIEYKTEGPPSQTVGAQFTNALFPGQCLCALGSCPGVGWFCHMGPICGALYNCN